MRPWLTSVRRVTLSVMAAAACGLGSIVPAPARAADYAPVPGDFHMAGFRFASGETLPDLRLHYWTLGTPTRNSSGHITNAIVLLHGTGGDENDLLPLGQAPGWTRRQGDCA